jgi:hypothetical protein
LPTPPNVCSLHWDDDPFNNVPSNLRWGTRADNVADAVRNGRSNAARGEANGLAVLTDAIVRAARERYVPFCRVNGIAAMARGFGVNLTALRYAVHGISWKHV